MRHIILGILFALLVSCSQPSQEFSEFDFEEVPKEEPIILQPVEAEKPVLTEKDLRACLSDSDCVLVQPDACCACPAAINKDVDYPTLPLGQEPRCKEMVPCGVCAESNELEAKCITKTCIAKKKIISPAVQPIPDPKEEPKEDSQEPQVEQGVSFYPIPELESSANFKELALKPSCFREYNAVYFRYSMKQPANTKVQVREEADETYTTIFTETQNIFQNELTIVICPKCIINNYGILRTDKKYFLRLESDFDKELTYTPDYIIDTHANSEYTVKQCVQ